jgi:hypothetical protein
LANRPAWQNGNIATNPAVCINSDPPAYIRASGTRSLLRIDRQCRSVNIDIGSDIAPIANLDFAGVRNSAIPSNGNVLANVDVITTITMEGTFKDEIIAYSTNR